jgi:ABC-2 type transport system permease protein
MTAPSTALGTGVRPRFDPGRTRGGGSSDLVRSFRTAAVLGWKMEANWTDPVLFLIYSVAKPVSAALILVAMLEVITGASGREFRGFVVVGSALWSFVISGIAGLAWSVLDDRERYRMLKYVYVSPSEFVVVLLGRGTARIAVGAMGAVITLAVGVLLLGVAFDPLAVDWLLLVVAMALGLHTIVVVGLILAAVCLQTRQESWSYPEAVAGALFLISGAVFPLAVLPAPIQVIGLLNPLSWWLEGCRRALFPDGATSVGGAGSVYAELTGRLVPDAPTIVLALLVTGAVATLGGAVVFRWSERRAKDRGLIDQTTGS